MCNKYRGAWRGSRSGARGRRHQLIIMIPGSDHTAVVVPMHQLQKQLSLIEEEPKETDSICVDENDATGGGQAPTQDKRKYSLQNSHRKSSRKFSLKERFSLPNLGYRKASTDSTISTESLKFHLLDKEWRSIFEKLDSRDGKKDNKIQRRAFLKWVSTLDFQNALSLETKQGVSRYVVEQCRSCLMNKLASRQFSDSLIVLFVRISRIKIFLR